MSQRTNGVPLYRPSRDMTRGGIGALVAELMHPPIKLRPFHQHLATDIIMWQRQIMMMQPPAKSADRET